MNQNQGIATKLMIESLADVKSYLNDNKSKLITTRADNKAQSLYKEVLNAEIVSAVKHLYSADEVLMIASSL